VKFQELLRQEAERGGVLDVNVNAISSLLTYAPGYLDRADECIVGLQTEKPLCRGVNPFGGLRMAREACEAYGYTLGPAVEQAFAYRTTHNDGVFHVYNETMRQLRKHGIITGLPDAYGRGRIIGDYRRVALYGVDALMAAKRADKDALSVTTMTEETIRRCEELWKEIDFLEKLKEMAAYGFDISGPACHAQEAVQWIHFAYLRSDQGAERRRHVAGARQRLYRPLSGRASSQCERAGSGAASGGASPSRALSAAHHPRLRLCGQLQPSEPQTAG
jgi:formate C-acetyltransferase